MTHKENPRKDPNEDLIEQLLQLYTIGELQGFFIDTDGYTYPLNNETDISNLPQSVALQLLEEMEYNQRGKKKGKKNTSGVPTTHTRINSKKGRPGRSR